MAERDPRLYGTREIASHLLEDTSTWFVVGLGNNPDRDAYGIARLLQSRGKRIVPIYPRAEVVHGEQGYATIAEAAEAAETAPAPVAAKPARPVVAVRGDDRPGQKKTEAQAAKSGRREGRPGERRDDRGPREGRREFGREGAGREGGRDAWRDEPRAPRLADAAFRAQRDARERAELALRKLAAQAHGETLVRVLSAWESRQAEALPSAQELGKAVSASARQAWAQALGQAAASQAGPSLLRLEMAAEVPTPAEHLSERRALQLQLLTQRREAGPAQTWAHDVAQVLASAHDAASARRLQNALKQLLRR